MTRGVIKRLGPTRTERGSQLPQQYSYSFSAKKKKKARARLFLFLFRIRTSFLKFKKRKEKKKSVVAHSILRIEGFPDFCQTGLKV